jgi:hypothetical protein
MDISSNQTIIKSLELQTKDLIKKSSKSTSRVLKNNGLSVSKTV